MMKRDDVLRVEDVVFIPPQRDPKMVAGVLKRWVTSETLSRILGVSLEYAEEMLSALSGFAALASLCDEYVEKRRRLGHEPEWVKELPKQVRLYLRTWFVFSDGFDPLGIMPMNRYSGFGYAVEEGGLLEDVEHAFNLFRLGSVRQLAFLSIPPRLEDHQDFHTSGYYYSHTRWAHSLDVAAHMTLIGHNNELPDYLMRHARVAGISHDGMTPAGGDTTKLVDFDAFNEETHYGELFEREGWRDVRDKHGLSERLLFETVNGRGILGGMLDFADKLSYVAYDAYTHTGSLSLAFLYDDNEKLPVEKHYTQGYRRVAETLRDNPLVCSIWDAVAVDVDRDEVYCTDADRLAEFLRLRALLFRDIYYNPYAKSMEFVIGSVVMKFLYENRGITREELVVNGDYWLQDKIDDVVGRFPLSRIRSVLNPRDVLKVETYSDLKEAMQREAELTESGLYVIRESWGGGTGTGTKLKVEHEGTVTPFYEARPDEAREITSLMTIEKPHSVIYIDADIVPPKGKFAEAFAAYRRRRAKSLKSGTSRKTR